jgi:hypothetical protein
MNVPESKLQRDLSAIGGDRSDAIDAESQSLPFLRNRLKIEIELSVFFKGGSKLG